MKASSKLQAPSNSFPNIAFAVLVSLPLSVSAASITIGPIIPGTSGSVIQQPGATYAATQVSSTRVKVTGLGDYTATGSTSAITLSIGGLISAVVGEPLSLDYDFSLILAGSGSVAWSLNTIVTISGFPIPGPSSNGGPITSADNGTFTGSRSAPSPLTVSNVPWSALLTVNWSGATVGDTLQVSIPTNSIDLTVVPEPSSILLVGLGGVLLTRRRRSL